MAQLEFWVGGENVAERGPLATVGGPLANTQKKNLEMMVNPGVGGYTKTLNHRKILWKKHKKQKQPTENHKGAKTEI